MHKDNSNIWMYLTALYSAGHATSLKRRLLMLLCVEKQTSKGISRG